MTRWPEPTPSAESTESSWVQHLTSDELNILMAISDAEAVGPIPEEARDLYFQIRSKAEAATKSETASNDDNAIDSVEEPSKHGALANWFRTQWETANLASRLSLESLANALGFEVPADPPPKMQRTKAPTGRKFDDTDQGKGGGERPKPSHAASQSAQTAKPRPKTPKNSESDASNEEIDQDGGWQPCESLFDALHPENRGWL